MKVHSIAQAFLGTALSHPERVAIKIKNERLTYRELLYKSLQVANTLNELGANKLAVGVVGQRHMASYVGVLGALFAGCYYVPINPKLIKDKITSIFIDSKINFLIGDIDNFEKIKSSLDDYSKAIKVTPFQYAPDDDNWIDKAVIDSKSDQIDTKTIELNDLAYVMYTSGSTGNPKGVKVSHSNLLAYLEAINNLWNLPENFNMSQFHDLSFDPSVSDMFFTLTNGGTLCVVPEDEMLMPSDFIINEKIDIWSSVPSIGSFMLSMGALEKGIFPNLKIVRFAGEPLSKKIADAWQRAAPKSSVENHYGPTEATIDVLSFCYTKYNSKATLPQGIPVGKPMKNMTVEIVDNNSEKVTHGLVGELVYKGPQISQGYLNDEKKTNSVFVQFDWDKSGEIWYKSGDLGLLNQNGDFECIGRKDNQIKLGGQRIEIGEIESALSKFKLLQDVVVVPIKNDDQITTGCVGFTMNEISKDDQIIIRDQSSKHLEQVFFPKKIVKLDQFPRSPSGKIDRKVLSLKAKNL